MKFIFFMSGEGLTAQLKSNKSQRLQKTAQLGLRGVCGAHSHTLTLKYTRSHIHSFSHSHITLIHTQSHTHILTLALAHTLPVSHLHINTKHTQIHTATSSHTRPWLWNSGFCNLSDALRSTGMYKPKLLPFPLPRSHHSAESFQAHLKTQLLQEGSQRHSHP